MPATVKLIKEVTGVEKVAYAGFSQGTTLAFYALTKEIEETFWADNVSCFIALAPCLIIPPSQTYEDFIDGEWKALPSYPNFLGENFSSDGYCSITGESSEMCQTARFFEPLGFPSVDTRSIYQYNQMGIENRFQAFSENYDQPDGRQTELADIT